MSALACDLQLDFWTGAEPDWATAEPDWAAAEPDRSGGPTLGAVVAGQPVGGERTLEDLILGAWEELAAHHSVSCPVCAGTMAPEYGVHALPVRATCGECGTQLS